MTSCYVYAIQPVESDLPRDLRGFHESELSRICYRDLAAVVAPQDSTDVAPTPERVQAHHDVVSKLRSCGPALPVRFGTVFPTGDALTGSLQDRYSTLCSDMDRLDGTVEYGITVLWGSYLEGRDRESDPSPGDHLETSGASYMLRRLREYQRETELHRVAEDLVSYIEHALAPSSRTNKLTTLASLDIPVRGSFLVDSSSSEEFEGRFQDLRERFPELRFLLVGPWPPYSFVSTNEDRAPGTLGANSVVD